MVIVEGPDNVGKTTLINQLLDNDDELHLVKRKRFNPRRNETIGSSYINALLPGDDTIQHHSHGVVDRLLASECIYGDLFRDGCRMTDNEHFIIRSLLKAYRAMVVHCDAPDEEIIRSWKDREQLYDNPLLIAHAYRERLPFIFQGLEIFRYDWTSPSASDMREYIVHRHRQIQQEIEVGLVVSALAHVESNHEQ